MINAYKIEDISNDPKWSQNELVVEFTFNTGLMKSVTIDTSQMSKDEIWDLRNQLIGKRKLLQSIFEHGTHGQITVQGLTVRADDLIAMDIR